MGTEGSQKRGAAERVRFLPSFSSAFNEPGLRYAYIYLKAILLTMAKSSGGSLISLFTGAGGLDYGFSLAGFKTVFAADYSKEAVDTFNKNLGDKVAIKLDLSKIKPVDFIKKLPAGEAPIGLIGGPPCQGFSRGNVFADADDPRNTLPFRYATLLDALNKKFKLHFFVFENVADLTGPKHIKRFNRIVNRLRKAGFNVFFEVLNAADYSVPQRRKRVFIVGLNNNLYPDAKFSFPPKIKKIKTVSDAIAHLPTPQFYKRGMMAEEIGYHPNHWTMMPKSAKLKNGLSSGRSFRRLEWNEISPTVAYGNREIHVHPDGGRRLSILEAMLLQGFPESYKLTGNLSSQVTQVSNAVPPPMAKAIAKQLKEILV